MKRYFPAKAFIGGLLRARRRKSPKAKTLTDNGEGFLG
jgi:hypothetical protein